MVQLPICDRCASTEELCEVDREKLEKGYITEFDVQVARILYDMDKYFRIGDEVELIRAYDLGSFVLIVIRGEIGRLIGKKGKVLKELRNRIGKPVRIVEVDVDEKKTVQDLFSGVRVIGVSRGMTPSGPSYTIYILRRDAKFLPFPFKDMEKALKVLLNKQVRIEFVE